MSGIFLELCHIFEAFNECIICPRRRQRHASYGEISDVSSVSSATHRTTLTLRSPVPLGGGYDPLLPQHEDHIDACAGRIYQTMFSGSNPTLTLEALIAMTPIVQDADLVQRAARHLFLSHVKSHPSVKDVFFPNHKPDPNYRDKVDSRWFDFRRFACLFVCQALTKVKDEYGLSELLDERKVDEAIGSLYFSPFWKKIGFSLYTILFQDLVRDETSKVPFSAFLEDDRQGWGRRLQQKVLDKQWMYSNIVYPVVRGRSTNTEYNREINILFVKLHLLDPTTVMSTFDVLRKALPDLNLELVTTNYLGGPLDWRLIQSDVESAVTRSTYPTRTRLSLADVDVIYGLEVLEFIMSEAKDINLWTGKEANNHRISHPKERCVIM